MTKRYVPEPGRYTALARQAAAEGCVLLENKDGALPLKRGEQIALFGRIQFDYYKSGTGSGGLVNAKYTTDIPAALKEAGVILNRQVEDTYRGWLKEHPFDRGSGWAQEPWSQEEMPLDGGLVRDAAAETDTAVVIIGRTAGEDRDAAAKKGSYFLTDTEEDMLRKICAAFSRTVVVLNTGSIMDMKWVEKYQPSAVLYVWQGGMEGGHGAADVLTGRVNPCGKLTDTIARELDDYPSSANFGGDTGNIYEEDIYVGYRYFETFAREKVLYPFGYGLSYTTFALRNIPAERRAETGASRTVIRVSISNTGTVPGREVVQVYVKAPQGKLGRPLRQLAAFQKTCMLKPGETEEMEFDIRDTVFAAYDDSGASGYKSCYVLEPGVYEFFAGTDVRRASYAGCMEIRELTVTEVCRQSAAPVRSFRRMKPAVSERGQVLVSWENTPLRTGAMAAREAGEIPADIPYTGDKGIRLRDVFDKEASMREFLGQLTDTDLCCIVKGEGMGSPKVTPGTAAAFGGVTERLQSFGVPCGCCADGPSGIRMDCGTHAFSLPGGVCLASTFDESLMEDLFEMTGAELRMNRIDTLLGPGMNIHRHPLNGRNFEYFSEDPLVTGKIAAAQLRGMARAGVTGTVKHFAANNQEHNRRRYDSVLSERALREIYLKGFEIAVKEGGAYSVMTTYGAVNGVWTAGNYDLVTEILRREWGFDGMVMTDWWAEMNEEGGEPSIQNLAAMVRAQNDVFMVVPDTEKHMGNLEESLAEGTLTRGMLARCAENILKMLMRSPAMLRMLGRISREEQEAYERLPGEDMADFDLIYHRVDGEITLPLDGICTDRGKSMVYGLTVAQPGAYRLTMEVRADAGKLAQIPVSVFLNGVSAGMITVGGTGGKWIKAELKLGRINFPSNYIRLYFAQSGMKIRSIRMWKEEEA